MQIPEILGFDNKYFSNLLSISLNYILITFITEPWPGNITVGFKSKINCNDFKYSVRSSNTVVPSPSTQSAENNALSSSKNITIWSVVWPGVWWILKILNSKIIIVYAMFIVWVENSIITLM